MQHQFLASLAVLLLGTGAACAAGETSADGGGGSAGGINWSGGGGSGAMGTGAGNPNGGNGGGGESSGGGGAAGGNGGDGGVGGSGGTGGAGGAGGSGGAGGAGGSGGGGGGPLAYSHTIAIDGVNDFNSSESFQTTSSPTYTGYVSWDADYVYLGMSGTDVGSGSSSFWVLAYIGNGTAGTTTGQTYGSQTPTLPFQAKYHLRWKADNTYTNAQIYLGAAWVEANWVFTGDIVQSGNYVELRIPRNDIGDPDEIDLHLDMINEPGTWTYAGVPSTSFVDGADRDFTQHFHFDLTSDVAPNLYTPL